jgi:hypothetical protein
MDHNAEKVGHDAQSNTSVHDDVPSERLSLEKEIYDTRYEHTKRGNSFILIILI